MAGERGGFRSVKELTVLVDVGDNRTISAMSVIESVESEVGKGVVEACVPKSGNMYEITLSGKDAVDLITDTGFKVNDTKFSPNAVFSKEKLVSFLNVSYYVPDEEIRTKLEDFGAELITPIKRRMHPTTKIADGTRYVVVRFPDERQSLPYTMKFSTGVNSHEYIRVIHDNQKKVCSKCYETGHVYATCPDNNCFRCKGSGHLARGCPKPPCEKCHRYLAKCICVHTDGFGHGTPRFQDADVVSDLNDNDPTLNSDDKDQSEVDTAVESTDEDDNNENVVNEVQTNDDKIDNKMNKGKLDEKMTVDDASMINNEHIDNDNNDINDDLDLSGGSGDAHPSDMVKSSVAASAIAESVIADDESLPMEEPELEMSEQEFSVVLQNAKKKKRRLVPVNTGPSLTPDDIKRLRSNPRHKLTPKTHSSS